MIKRDESRYPDLPALLEVSTGSPPVLSGAQLSLGVLAHPKPEESWSVGVSWHLWFS